MIRQFRHHNFYYGSLLFIEALALMLILLAKGNKQLQLFYMVVGASAYILWGFIHHKIHHDLHTKVVIEYVLMGSLGISIIFFLLQ